MESFNGGRLGQEDVRVNVLEVVEEHRDLDEGEEEVVEREIDEERARVRHIEEVVVR